MSLLLTLPLLVQSPQIAESVSPPVQSLVEVDLESSALNLEDLLERGFDIVSVKPEGRVYEVLVDEVSRQRMDALELSYEVVHADLASYYADRARGQVGKLPPPSQGAWLSPPFGQGSMGGFYTFAEVVSILDQITAAYPALTTDRFSVGSTLEGRDIWAVKISDNPDLDEGEPEVRFDAMHHAREPQSMQTTLWIMLCLLEGYGTDPLATYLVDNREMWFLPVVNPDGYVYNQSTDPGGGGLWRKNRRANGGGSSGVDLNRNYSFEWGFDNSGSSPTPTSETYRGTGPASEPEVEAMQAFIDSRDFRTALSAHTYSNLWLYPFGYDNLLTSNDAEYDEVSQLATASNGYVFGPANVVLYPANGVTIDFDHDHGTLSWTPEIGGTGDGFWPAPSRIVPLAEENEDSFLRTAWAAGAYVHETGVNLIDTGDGDGFFEPGESVEITIDARNSGLDGTTATVGLSSMDPQVTVTGSSASLGTVAPFSSASNAVALAFTIDSGAPVGSAIQLTTTLEYEGFVQSNTQTVLVGQLRMFLTDDAEVDLGWLAGLPGDTATTGLWAHGDPVGTISNGAPANPEDDATAGGVNCFTTGNGSTSAGGDDVDNGLTTLISPRIDLSGVSGAILAYKRWFADLSTADDVFQVSISDDDGGSWQPLENVTTTQNAWTEVSFNVADFVALTDSVRLRFIAEDDPNNSLVEAAVDDLSIEIFDDLPRLNFYGSPVIDTPLATHLSGEPGDLFTIYASPNTQSLTLPNVQGTILIGPGQLSKLQQGTVPAGGFFRSVATLPNSPSLVGSTFYMQSLNVGGGLRVSNRTALTFQ